MKLYKTSALTEDGVTKASWQGTQIAAGAARKSYKDAGHSDITTEEVDVPTHKSGLLAWLNENVTGE